MSCIDRPKNKSGETHTHPPGSATAHIHTWYIRLRLLVRLCMKKVKIDKKWIQNHINT